MEIDENSKELPTIRAYVGLLSVLSHVMDALLTSLTRIAIFTDISLYFIVTPVYPYTWTSKGRTTS